MRQGEEGTATQRRQDSALDHQDAGLDLGLPSQSPGHLTEPPSQEKVWPKLAFKLQQSESSYNWETEQWSVPVTAALSKLVMFGKVPVSLQGGMGYWMESPDNGPEGLRFRLQANIVLPR